MCEQEHEVGACLSIYDPLLEKNQQLVISVNLTLRYDEGGQEYTAECPNYEKPIIGHSFESEDGAITDALRLCLQEERRIKPK